MEYLGRQLTRLGLEHVPSQANFILVKVGNGDEVFKRLLLQAVIVRPMRVYQFPEHVRVTVGLPEENQRFIAALERTIQAA